MNHIKKILSLFTVSLLLAACGTESGSSLDQGLNISGQVQQGNIKDAQVFLDLNGNGVQESGEPVATNLTGADGKFVLSLTGGQVALMKASATARIVSEGGTDTTTGLAASLLVADPPAVAGDTATKNVTPMTTLVAMTPDDQKGKLKEVLATLGMKDDALIEGSTPAVIALAKSVETVLLTLHKSVSTKANGDVARAVARGAAAEIGKALAVKTKDDITDTEKLSNILSFAAGAAVNQIPTDQLNVHVADLVAAIKVGSWEAAEAVKSGTGGILSTSGSHSEVEIMTAEVKGRINDAVNTATTKIEGEVAPPNVIIPTTKTATVAFSVSSLAPLTVPVQALTVTAILPAGVTVATNAGTTDISAAALAFGSAITAPNSKLVSGIFDAYTRKVTITVTTMGDTFLGGEFAKLTVSFQSPPILTAADFGAATLFEATGYDLVNQSTVVLTSNLQAALGVTFN